MSKRQILRDRRTTNMNKIFQKEREERREEHLCFCCRKKGSPDGKTFRRRKALPRTNTPRRIGSRLCTIPRKAKGVWRGRKERGEGKHLHNSTSKCLLRPRTRINAKPVAPHPPLLPSEAGSQITAEIRLIPGERTNERPWEGRRERKRRD